MEGVQLSFFEPEISEEEARLRKILTRGSGYEGGCLRIYAAEQILDANRFAMFLADEFGIGGHSIGGGFADYNGGGIVVRLWSRDSEDMTFRYTWRQIAGVYHRMIADGSFPDEKTVRLFHEARKAGKGAPAPKMYYYGEE